MRREERGGGGRGEPDDLERRDMAGGRGNGIGEKKSSEAG
jgi:hypothetical protein